MLPSKLQERRDRAVKVAHFLRIIASCGRYFFRHGERVSYMEVDYRGRVWFVDAYSGKRIYTHYNGEWRGFTNGGTMRSLVNLLRDFIMDGEPRNTSLLGPWPDWYCDGDLWGYGDAMTEVREAATRLGVITPKEVTKAEAA